MGCTVHIVRWTKCNTPYVPSELPNVNYYDRNTFANVHSLLHKVREIKPDLIWAELFAARLIPMIGTLKSGVLLIGWNGRQIV